MAHETTFEATFETTSEAMRAAAGAMSDERARAILQALADGADPASGAAFPAGSPYQRTDTVRALFHAIRALETALSQAGRKPRSARGNAGQPWSPEEDASLAAGFDAGQPLALLAATHGRSRFAIEARLAKLGKESMPTGVRAGGAPRVGEWLPQQAARP